MSTAIPSPNTRAPSAPLPSSLAGGGGIQSQDRTDGTYSLCPAPCPPGTSSHPKTSPAKRKAQAKPQTSSPPKKLVAPQVLSFPVAGLGPAVESTAASQDGEGASDSGTLADTSVEFEVMFPLPTGITLENEDAEADADTAEAAGSGGCDGGGGSNNAGCTGPGEALALCSARVASVDDGGATEGLLRMGDTVIREGGASTAGLPFSDVLGRIQAEAAAEVTPPSSVAVAPEWPCALKERGEPYSGARADAEAPDKAGRAVRRTLRRVPEYATASTTTNPCDPAAAQEGLVVGTSTLLAADNLRNGLHGEEKAAGKAKPEAEIPQEHDKRSQESGSSNTDSSKRSTRSRGGLLAPPALRKPVASGFIGVFDCPGVERSGRGRWEACIKDRASGCGHQTHLGYFQNEADAARRYDEVAAPLGFPLNFSAQTTAAKQHPAPSRKKQETSQAKDEKKAALHCSNHLDEGPEAAGSRHRARPRREGGAQGELELLSPSPSVSPKDGKKTEEKPLPKARSDKTTSPSAVPSSQQEELKSKIAPTTVPTMKKAIRDVTMTAPASELLPTAAKAAARLSANPASASKVSHDTVVSSVLAPPLEAATPASAQASSRPKKQAPKQPRVPADRRTRNGKEGLDLDTWMGKQPVEYAMGRWPSKADVAEGWDVPVVIRGFARDVAFVREFNKGDTVLRRLDNGTAQLHVKVAETGLVPEGEVPAMANAKVEMMTLNKFLDNPGYSRQGSTTTAYMTAFGKDFDVRYPADAKFDQHSPFLAVSGLMTLVPPIAPQCEDGNTQSTVSVDDTTVCSFQDICSSLQQQGKVPQNFALWVSGAPVSTSTHFDDYMTVSMFAGNGEKRWFLGAPADALSGLLAPFKAPGDKVNHASRFEPWKSSEPAELGKRGPTRKLAPLKNGNFEKARSWFHEVVVRNGDLLIVPKGWWHAVVTTGRFAAVNWWWTYNKEDIDDMRAWKREADAPDDDWPCWRCGGTKNGPDRLKDLAQGQAPSCSFCCHIKGSATEADARSAVCVEEVAWRCPVCTLDNTLPRGSTFEARNWQQVKCLTCQTQRLIEKDVAYEAARKAEASIEARTERIAEDGVLSGLISMGFDKDIAAAALREISLSSARDMSLGAAMDWILDCETRRQERENLKAARRLASLGSTGYPTRTSGAPSSSSSSLSSSASSSSSTTSIHSSGQKRSRPTTPEEVLELVSSSDDEADHRRAAPRGTGDEQSSVRM